MKSRMDRYYDASLMEKDNSEDTETLKGASRTKKNDQLYKEVSSLKIDSFDVNSNVSVIGKNSKNIDIQDVQEILDKKYHEKSKKKSFGNAEMRDMPKIKLDETREYDINSIIEKARTNKEINYEEDRLKKLRETQYDLLKKIDGNEINEEKVEEPEKTRTGAKKTNKELLSLIDTITTKELINEQALKSSTKSFTKSLEEDTAEIVTEEDTILDNTLVSKNDDLDPLDILSDLRGNNENTKVLGINDLQKNEQELAKDLEKTRVSANAILEKNENDIKDTIDDKKVKETEKALKQEKDRSTTSTITTFSKADDFDDFDDLKKDMGVTRIIVKILIVILVLSLIAGCLFLVNKFFGLGLF